MKPLIINYDFMKRIFFIFLSFSCLSLSAQQLIDNKGNRNQFVGVASFKNWDTSVKHENLKDRQMSNMRARRGQTAWRLSAGRQRGVLYAVRETLPLAILTKLQV